MRCTNRFLLLLTLACVASCGPAPSKKPRALDETSIEEYLKTPSAFAVLQDPNGAGLIVVRCVFDEKPRMCLLDSGGIVSIVYEDDETKSYTKTGSIQRGSLAGMYASSTDLIDVPNIQVASLAVGGQRIARDNGTFPQGQLKLGIRGVIGNDILSRYALHLDFDKYRMKLDPTPATMESALSLEDNGQGHVVLPAKLGDQEIKGIWDTGASITCVDQAFVAAHPDLFVEVRDSTVRDGGDKEVKTKLLKAKKLTLGGLEFTDLAVMSLDFSVINGSSQVPTSILFGFNAISKGNWHVDFQAKKWKATPLAKK